MTCHGEGVHRGASEERPEGSARAKAQGPELAWCVLGSARGPAWLSRGPGGESGRRPGGRRPKGAPVSIN